MLAMEVNDNAGCQVSSVIVEDLREHAASGHPLLQGWGRVAGDGVFDQADCRWRPFAVILAGFQKFANECCPSWKSTRS